MMRGFLREILFVCPETQNCSVQKPRGKVGGSTKHKTRRGPGGRLAHSGRSAEIWCAVFVTNSPCLFEELRSVEVRGTKQVEIRSDVWRSREGLRKYDARIFVTNSPCLSEDQESRSAEVRGTRLIERWPGVWRNQEGLRKCECEIQNLFGWLSNWSHFELTFALTAFAFHTEYIAEFVAHMRHKSISISPKSPQIYHSALMNSSPIYFADN